MAAIAIERLDWAIVLVGSASWIEGATRIQKYAFLGFKTVKGLGNKGFYDDWMPSKYGPFSPNLAEDIDSLLQGGLLGKYKVKNEYGYFVDRFALTETGKRRLDSIRQACEPFASSLGQIVAHYNGKALLDVLHDVYYQFPEYAYASVVRPEVANRAYESDSYLNPESEQSEE